MPDITVSQEGVLKLLKKINPHKASGPDMIPAHILKDVADAIAPILTVIFQRTFSLGEVPNDWKSASVIPIFKKGDRFKASNYRCSVIHWDFYEGTFVSATVTPKLQLIQHFLGLPLNTVPLYGVPAQPNQNTSWKWCTEGQPEIVQIDIIIPAASRICYKIFNGNTRVQTDKDPAYYVFKITNDLVDITAE